MSLSSFFTAFQKRRDKTQVPTVIGHIVEEIPKSRVHPGSGCRLPKTVQRAGPAELRPCMALELQLKQNLIGSRNKKQSDLVEVTKRRAK